MNPKERRTTYSLACIYAFRMLGLFMILPIFSLYAHQFTHANMFLIGLALGIYGLTQACLQIPFGMCSDRIGRKPVILLGLVLFAIGSIIAAEAHSIYGIILGRAIQGSGAVGSTLTALLADNVEDEHRLKAMSMIGMTIGTSFIAAMMLGPVLNHFIGLSGIFWLTAILALCGIMILFFLVPTPQHHHLHRDSEAVFSQLGKMLANPELLRLDFGIFSLHATLTALFITIPIILLHRLHLLPSHQWELYVPVLVLSFFAMVPFIIIAEAKRKMKPVFVGAIITLVVTQVVLWFNHSNMILLALMLFCFFTAFTLLEASLPSLVAKISPAGSKGTAMGVYSSTQFLGIFFGGLVGGALFHHVGLSAVFLFCAILCACWALLAITMKKPRHLSSKILHLTQCQNPSALQTQLRQIPGVADAIVIVDESVAYLKVDKKVLDQVALDQLVMH